ncbi:MAG: hypothetical protein LBG52_07755 [Candidatus Peribacteria bacterium]|nr:hypothetical protein [Candidatus Peribacteria bacterium]
MVIMIVLALGIYAIIHSRTPVQDTKTYSLIHNVNTGEVSGSLPILDGKIDEIRSLLETKTPVEIEIKATCQEKAGFQTFEESFDTKAICEKASMANRDDWWIQEGRSEYRKFLQKYEDWKDQRKPFQRFAVVLDITEKNQYEIDLNQILTGSVIQSIVSQRSENEIILYTVVDKSTPGHLTLKGTIAEMNVKANKFLSAAQRELPKSYILENLAHIMSKNFTEIYVISDMLINNGKINAYLDKNEEIELGEYFSEIKFPQNIHFVVKTHEVYGTKYEKWYQNLETSLREFFSGKSEISVEF